MRHTMLVLALAAMVAGAAFAGGQPEPADEGPIELTVWTFDQFFKEYYESMRADFEAENPGVTYEVQLFDYDALYERFNTVVLTGGQEAPDLIDVESGQFGNYMRGQIPFLPVGNRIVEAGYGDAIAPGRLALYSVDGEVYGLEHQLVPVTVAYRADLFEQAGIDVDDIETWDDYVEAGRVLREEAGAYILGFNNTAGGVQGQVGVLTRGANRPVVGEDGNPDIANPVWIAVNDLIRSMVKDDQVAAEYENWQDFWAAPSANEMAGVVVADWTANALKNFAPEQEGQWAMMALPRLNPQASRISVWGGTGLASTVYSEYPEEAFALQAFLQLRSESTLAKNAMNGSIPPTPASLSLPQFRQPDPYFGGQIVVDLYAEYVDELPEQRPAWWVSEYNRAYADHFFDFWEGTIDAAEFAARVQASTEEYIAAAQ
jgi:ABC-type glycerol-3-phosphate transport system substrate-binding protein